MAGAKMFNKNLTSVFLVLASLLIVQVSGEGNGHCVWYDECYTNELEMKRPCIYNGEPKLLNTTGQRLLSKWCPHLVNNPGSGVKTCCSVEQLQTFDDHIPLLANILATCPNCSTNLIKHMCEYICSPVQSNFVEVTDIATSNTTNATYVDSIRVYITNRYILGTYNSCSNITAPNTDTLVFDLMCDDWDLSECTPERWFNFLGDADNNPFIPFQITYHFTDTPVDRFIPLDIPVAQCSEELKHSTANNSHSVVHEDNE